MHFKPFKILLNHLNYLILTNLNPIFTMKNILVTGATGQIGTELVESLKKRYPKERIWSLDIKNPQGEENPIDFLKVDLMDKDSLEKVIEEIKPIRIYHLAAILSAVGENNPLLAWNLNMNGLLNILNLSVKHQVTKVFWPSSIAVFGPQPNQPYNAQKENMEPITVYGISKLSGEHWCSYYRRNFNLDIRSIRFPGLISYKTEPGGGTTDYSVDIYKKALKTKTFTCYLQPDTVLPMMFMEDAIRAIHELMEAQPNSLKTKMAYNIAGFSASPIDFAKSIQKRIPDFEIQFSHHDPRQIIADSWPDNISDLEAQREWGWKCHFDLEKTTEEMLKKLPLPL